MSDRTITINVNIQYDEDKMTEEAAVEASNYLFMSSIFDKEMSDRIKEQGISHIAFSKERPVSHPSNLTLKLLHHVTLLRMELDIVVKTLEEIIDLSSDGTILEQARYQLRYVNETLEKTAKV